MGTARLSANGWVALLRGINVGGRNVVPMAELRDLFEDAGAAGAATFIQSGNVVFTHATTERAALAAWLEVAIQAAFGVKSAVVLRTFSELAEIAVAEPFGPDNSLTHVVFLERAPAAAAVRELAGLEVAPDRIEVVGSNVFLHYPNGVSGSRLTGALLERRLGVSGTARNWRTVTRLAELANRAMLGSDGSDV